jgi:outer membrane protein assembly factor BamB
LLSLSGGSGCQESRSEPSIGGVLERDVHLESAAGPWSAWRGGQHQGYADLGRSITLDGPPRVRWKVALAGSGNSSPVVAGSTILLTAEVAPSDSDQSAPDLAIVALDAETGIERWFQVVGQALGPTHNKSGYASATIAASAERGFAFFGESGLICFDIATGHVLWRHEFPGNRHEWGIVSSPVLYGQAVIQLVDGEQGESFLAAFHQATGELVWRTVRESHGCWTSPLLMGTELPRGPGELPTEAGGELAVNQVSQVSARPQLIVNGTGHKDGSAGWLISYDPRTGEELWRAQGTSDIPVPTALVWNGLIISASGGNGPVFAIESDGQGDVTASHLRWKLPTGGPYVPTGLVVSDRLYLLTDGGALSCRDAATGDLFNRQRLGGTYTASLIGLPGYLLAVSEAGDLHILEEGEQLRLVASLSLHERCLATPAVVDGRLYLRTSAHLYCLGLAGLESEQSANVPPLSAFPAQRMPPRISLDETRVPDDAGVGGIVP